MSVHYKFKSTLNFDTISFDGLHISVGDLKRAIVEQKRLGKITDFDLQVTNAQTKEEYSDEACLIPKNTSLVIARIPLIQQSKKAWDPQPEKPVQSRGNLKPDGVSLDLSKMKGTEEEKIREMMLQSTAEYDPKSYQKTKGQYQTGEVPATYRCNKCKKGGHWIRNCPLGSGKEHIDVKRNTGIPKSFRDKDEKLTESEVQDILPTIEQNNPIPEDLICSICNDLFTDAVMIPCCGSSFCDDCVRTALLESEDNECPDCKEKGSSPGALIPNRFLRNSVNSFKNETGYKAAAPNKAPKTDPEILSSKIDDAVKKDEIEEVTDNVAEDETIEEDVTATATDSVPENQQHKPSEDPIEKTDDNIDMNENSEPKAKSPIHEEVESDYEDNITIKMPPSQMDSQRAVFRDRPFNGRRSRHIKPPGLESSPQNIPQVSPHHSQHESYGSPLLSQPSEWDRNYDRNSEYSSDVNNDAHGYKKSRNVMHRSAAPANSKPMDNYSACEVPKRPIRLANSQEMYPPGISRANTYQPIQSRLTTAQISLPSGPPVGPYDNMYNSMIPRPNLGYAQYVRPTYHNPGSGYMPFGRPPPSNMLPVSNLTSLYQDVAATVGTGIIDDPLEAFNRIMKEKEKRKGERYRSPDHRPSRSAESQQKGRFRPSSYERRNPRESHMIKKSRREEPRGSQKERGTFFRRKRSTSFSDRSSRSRSWSNSSIKGRAKSPHHHNRRSRSRTQGLEEKSQPTNFNRRKENSENKFRRSRSRDRLSSKQHPSWDSQKMSSGSGNSFKRNMRRSPTPQFERDMHRNAFKDPKHFDDCLSEAVEPPPPGFETNHWIDNNLEQVKLTRNKDYKDHKEHKRYNSVSREKRSRSRSSNKSIDSNKRYLPKEKSIPKPQAKHIERTDSKERIRSKSNQRREKAHRSDKTEESDMVKKVEKNNDTAHNTRESVKDKIVDGNKKNKHAYVEPLITEGSTESTFEKENTEYKLLDAEKEKSEKYEMKKEKKLKEHKKKKKEKTERKKSKRDKKDKRSRDKQKNTHAEFDFEQKTDVSASNEIFSNSADEIKHIQAEHEEISNLQNSSGNENSGNQTESKTALTTNEDPKHYLEMCEEGELPDEDTSTFVNSEITSQAPANARKSQTPPVAFHFDSILDLHGYEADLNESSYENQVVKTVPSIPEPSKWERDEPAVPVSYVIQKDEFSRKYTDTETNEKVTNEVLRKAENAIFARAVNAIRSHEIKKNHNEQQKTSSNQKSPTVTKIYRETSMNDIKSFQITVPRSSSQERSVEIRDNNRKRSFSPKDVKSIKERLGSKVFSRSEKHNIHKSISKDRDRSRDRSRDQNRDRSRDQNRDRSREQNRGRDWKHDATSEYKEHSKWGSERKESVDKNRDKNTTHDKGLDRQRDHEPSGVRESKGKNKFSDKDHTREHDHDRVRHNDKERKRDLEGYQERVRDSKYDRDRDRERDRENKSNTRHRSPEDDRSSRHGNVTSKKLPNRVEQHPTKRIKLMSCVDTMSHRFEEKDKYQARFAEQPDDKHVEKLTSTSNNKYYHEDKKSRHDYGSSDGRKCEGNSDHVSQTNLNEKSKVGKVDESKKDQTENAVRSSSASSTSEYDSSKRRKKRKYKKEKKRDKRSSVESTASSFKRQSKSRKKSKSIRKKKKGKKL